MMKKTPIFSLALVLLIALIMSCSQDAPMIDPFWVAQEDEMALRISLEATNITDETIEVTATVHSLGALSNEHAEDIEYGFVWFPTENPIDMMNIPEGHKITMGTISEDNTFTFRTTLNELKARTYYNVCTFVSPPEVQMMFGEEIGVQTL